jgi:serine/threonine protein kinase
MAAAVDQFLGNLRRTLSRYEKRVSAGAFYPAAYRVVGINEPYVNEKLEHCLVTERIGSGGMSVVYKAKQDFTDRIVAIKMLRAQLCCDPTNVKRFQREAKAIARLSHQNLLNVYGVGQTSSGQPYIIMDYIEGRSLAELIAAEGHIEWKRCASLFIQVCDAMHHAHAHRIIHRDLKPDNIMLVKSVTGADYVKVVDFGIVKITDESQALSQKLTQAGEVWGSPVYMSPEQCMGSELDHRSDIYSLGTVLYECLTGQQLFSGKRIAEIVMKQLNQKPPMVSSVRPDLKFPQWLEDVVSKALEKEPQKRFASMEEMKRTIEKGLLSNKDTADAVLKPAVLGPSQSQNISARVVKPPQDDFVGQMIGGKFLVEGLIGDGGMSVVYKAVQQGINRAVAIKFLRDELCDDEANVKRFQREARAVSQLSHPNLVSIYDVGTAPNGQPYMVMEYLQGKSLSTLLEEESVLSIERSLPIFIQICDVMHYAHSQGFIHRDLKPHNIMIVKSGDRPDFVKLVDFGIVALDGVKQAISQKLTAAGEICGSPIYMSPEQVLDEPVDARTDIYSFGIVMYECLSGRPVFGGKKITDVLNKHVNVPPPPFSEVIPTLSVPPAVEGIIFKALEKKPAKRYQSMDELKGALLQIQRRLRGDVSAPVSLAREAPPVGKARVIEELPPKKVNWIPVVAIVVALLAAAIGFAMTMHMTRQSGEEPKQGSTSQGTENDTSGNTTMTGETDTDPPSIKLPPPQQKRVAEQNGQQQLQQKAAVKPAAKPRTRKATPRSGETLSDELNAIEGAHLRRHKQDDYSGLRD